MSHALISPFACYYLSSVAQLKEIDVVPGDPTDNPGGIICSVAGSHTGKFQQRGGRKATPYDWRRIFARCRVTRRRFISRLCSADLRRRPAAELDRRQVKIHEQIAAGKGRGTLQGVPYPEAGRMGIVNVRLLNEALGSPNPFRISELKKIYRYIRSHAEVHSVRRYLLRRVDRRDFVSGTLMPAG